MPRIYERADGDMVLDFDPPHGPYVTLTPAQWKALVRAVRAREGR